MSTTVVALAVILGISIVSAAEITFCKVDADCTAVNAYDLCQEVEGST